MYRENDDKNIWNYYVKNNFIKKVLEKCAQWEN